jgi:hypothetical protein
MKEKSKLKHTLPVYFFFDRVKANLVSFIDDCHEPKEKQRLIFNSTNLESL